MIQVLLKRMHLQFNCFINLFLDKYTLGIIILFNTVILNVMRTTVLI